jgi:hypothetical protein
VSDWRLERMRHGEIPRDPSAAERLAALDASDREILAAHPPARVAAEVRRTAQIGDRSRIRALLFLTPAAAAAALAVVVLGRAPVAPEETTREKGALAPHLVVHRRASGGPELLRDGATARPGDVLQLSYVAAGRGYGVIVSLDGRGQVTLHWSAALDGGGAVPLPDAYELDDAPGFERFVLVTARAPFDAEAIVAAARALARDPARAHERPLEIAGGLEQSSLLLEKKP